jgi:PAS domain S-box-containing protein
MQAEATAGIAADRAAPEAGAAALAAAFVGAVAAPVAIVGRDQVCLAASPSFARRYGVEPAALAGRSLLLPAGAEIRPLGLAGAGLAVVTLPEVPAAIVPDDSAHGLLRAVVGAIPAVVNAKDRESRYLFMNDYQAQLYGTTPEAAVGKTAADLLGAAYGAYTRGLDQTVFETGRPIDFFEEQYAGVDGVARDWLTTKLPLKNADGAVEAVATVALDITDRKRLETQLAEAGRAAEQASRAKTLFLANMSHELRTPLNAILGFTELVSSEAFGPLGNPRYREYLDDVLRSGRHLLALISDMLDMARLDADGMALDIEPVHPAEIVGDVARMMEVAARAKQLTLAAAAPSRLPRASADMRRLRQVLLNLASNAVKFTPEGGAIEIGAEPRGNLVAFYVRDNGIGMDEAAIATALAVFGRVDTSYARQQDGAGLGLPLSKSLVERMGGRFEIESAPGRGTRVSALLPRAPATLRPAAATPGPAAPAR